MLMMPWNIFTCQDMLGFVKLLCLFLLFNKK